jgi:hypothetical protein
MRFLLTRRRRASLIAVPVAAFLCLVSTASADRTNNPTVFTFDMTCTNGGTETLTVTTTPGTSNPYHVELPGHGNVIPTFVSFTVNNETTVVLDRPGNVPEGLAVTCTDHLVFDDGTIIDGYVEGFRTP